MQIEFNTKNKTVTIIEMEAKDLHRITEFIKQVCGDDKGWKIVSKQVWNTVTTPAKQFDWRDYTYYSSKDGLIGDTQKYQVTCNDTSKSATLTDLTTEMNGKY
jgi:hypothetical protein